MVQFSRIPACSWAFSSKLACWGRWFPVFPSLVVQSQGVLVKAPYGAQWIATINTFSCPRLHHGSVRNKNPAWICLDNTCLPQLQCSQKNHSRPTWSTHASWLMNPFWYPPPPSHRDLFAFLGWPGHWLAFLFSFLFHKFCLLLEKEPAKKILWTGLVVGGLPNFNLLNHNVRSASKFQWGKQLWITCDQTNFPTSWHSVSRCLQWNEVANEIEKESEDYNVFLTWNDEFGKT